MSYLVAGQKTTAIWSCNNIGFHSKFGEQLVRHIEYYLFWPVLFCFGVTVVCIAPMKLQKLYLQFLSAPLQYWIILSGYFQHPARSCVFNLLQSLFYTLLNIYYKKIKSGHWGQYPDLNDVKD